MFNNFDQDTVQCVVYRPKESQFFIKKGEKVYLIVKHNNVINSRRYNIKVSREFHK